jgi:hypothetical protein
MASNGGSAYEAARAELPQPTRPSDVDVSIEVMVELDPDPSEEVSERALFA